MRKAPQAGASVFVVCEMGRIRPAVVRRVDVKHQIVHFERNAQNPIPPAPTARVFTTLKAAARFVEKQLHRLVDKLRQQYRHLLPDVVERSPVGK